MIAYMHVDIVKRFFLSKEKFNMLMENGTHTNGDTKYQIIIDSEDNTYYIKVETNGKVKQ